MITNDNILIKCDNINGLQWLIDNGYSNAIDLVYIDPPFATGGSFSVDNTGRASSVSMSKNGDIAYEDTLKGKEFLDFLKERIILIHTLLSDRGSLYLHIDYKIGHYVKVLLDEIFGIDNFRNDITRIKCNPKNFDRVGYGNVKDMILFYSKGRNPIWNKPETQYTEEEKAKLYNKIDKNGRRYTTVPIHAPGETIGGETAKPFKGIYPPPGRHWRCSVEELERLDNAGLIEWSKNGNPRKINYADERVGKKSQDIWCFKDPTYPLYPTQKNIDMLKFIINASSNSDSIVMDCFCGAGTTLKGAQECGRHWIGMDKSPLAIKITLEQVGNTDNTLFNNNYHINYFEINK